MMSDTTTLRPTPSLGAVLDAQGRLMGRTHWIAAVVTALLLAVMIGILGRNAALGQLSSPPALTVFLGRIWQPAEIVFFFWPLLVTWRGEAPSERGYHWSLPVRRSTHQLARVAAGWAWLVVAVVAGLLLGWIASAVMADGLALGPPGVIGAALLSLTVLYGLGTVFALLSDHALWWIVGSWAGLAALSAVAAAQQWTIVREGLRIVIESGSLSLSAAVSAPAVLAGVRGGSEALARPWAAALLWTAIALMAVVAAAHVRQERSAGAG